VFAVGSLVPLGAQAQIELYGAAKVSVDAIDDGETTNLNVADNSSRLGVKGGHELEAGLAATYKAEFGFNLTGETGGLSARDRYVGLAGKLGELRVGNHNTPFTDAAANFDMFGDTAADRRAILGRDASGNNRYNERANNSLVFISKRQNDMQFMVQYSSDYNSAKTSTNVDDNGAGLVGAGMNTYWQDKTLKLAVERHVDDDSTGVRASFVSRGGPLDYGLVGEYFTADNNDPMERSAIGANAAIKQGKYSYRAQVLVAASASDVNDSAAMNVAFGAFRAMGPQMTVYGVVTMTQNDSNAQYIVANETNVTPAAGDDPAALSVGLAYTF